jgi:hypothetical protein
MNVRKVLLSCALVFALVAGGVTIVHTQDRHPNLAVAIDLVSKAWVRVEAAERANEFDMNGHAERAKGLLTEAKQELQLAAQAADRHHDHDRR